MPHFTRRALNGRSDIKELFEATPQTTINQDVDALG